MKTHVTALVLITLVTGCGDDGPHHHPIDAGIDSDAPAALPRAVVVSGSFVPGEVGVLSVLDLGSKQVMQRVGPTGAVGSDPMLRKHGNELFIVNRAEGNITIVDATSFALVAQYATGAGSNPQDVALVGNKLYVPSLGTAGVVVIDRMAMPRVLSLASLDPMDGKPDCVSAYAVGTEVYVVCGTLDAQFEARGPGQVVVIDTATDTVKTMFTLANKNPLGVLEKLPDGMLGGDLIIPMVPQFGDFSTGCVERIRTGSDPTANGCVVANSDVDGYVSRIAFGGAIQWMVVSKYDTEARGNLQGYDLASRTLWPDPISPDTQVLVDVTVCPNNTVVVADSKMSANGLRIYEGGVETTTAPLPIGLAPGSAHGLTCY